MIPSRALTLFEIVGESGAIYVRTLPRYIVFFLILIVPGVWVGTSGSIETGRQVLTEAHRAIGYSDSDLTMLRNDLNAVLSKSDPAITSQFPGAGQPYPSSRTRAFLDYISRNTERFSSPLAVFGIGMIWIFLGMFVLTAATVELGSQVFEERPQEFWRTLGTAIAKHFWKVLFLYLLYLVVVWTLDAFLLVLPGGAGDALSGFVTIVQVYLIVRFSMTVPALVSEELGPFSALARSWQLTHRSGWRIFGIFLTIGILLLFVFFVIVLIAGMVTNDAFTWANDAMTKPFITLSWFLTAFPSFLRSIAIEWSVVVLLLFSFLTTAGTVLYYDLRTRHDGPLVYVDEEAA